MIEYQWTWTDRTQACPLCGKKQDKDYPLLSMITQSGEPQAFLDNVCIECVSEGLEGRIEARLRSLAEERQTLMTLLDQGLPDKQRLALDMLEKISNSVFRLRV